MTNSELIGRVAAAVLKSRITAEEEGGTARYLLDCLTADQTAAVAKTILADPDLSQVIEMRLPTHFVGNHGLPASVLTTERTTYFRNADCGKPALLLANTGDDEEQSLKELVPIGKEQLEADPMVWVNLATVGLAIQDEQRVWWGKALQALLEVRPLALDQFAQFVLETREAVDDGHPLISALGVSLPALRIPKDTAYFRGLNDRQVGHVSRWKQLYAHAFRKRACYLLKQTPTQSLLTEEDLEAAFERVKVDIPDELHPVVQTFISAKAGWNKPSQDIARCEWEQVKPLFDGLRREKFNLGQETLNFYDEREEDLLTAAERDYLKRLIARRTTEAQEEDEAFYRDHRLELKEQPSLKARWDRFIFGSPIETDDFIGGLAVALEALFDQDILSSKRKLRIHCDRRTKKDLKDINIDAGLFFAWRYRGLRELFGSRVTWETGSLFDFPKLEAEWRASGKPLNRSVARAALQLKFYLELEVELANGTTETSSKQIIWRFNPNAVTSEAQSDWGRLDQHPLVSCRANRESVDAKGRSQSIDLRDTKGLVPTYDRDRGSFVAIYRATDDVSLLWPKNLADSQAQGLIDGASAAELLALFQTFQSSYSQAIKGFLERGLAEPALTQQAKDFGLLVEAICRRARGDRNRILLLRPLLQLGAVAIEGGRTTTVIAPWHPLRMAAISVKARQVAALIRELATSEQIVFGDPRLFFKEREEELRHPYYPEVTLGWSENKPELLSLSDCYLDYTLHESPTVANDGYDETNESPSETGDILVDLTKRYLALYPHEQANLSVVLYNCDSARLPHALVDKLNDLHEDEEDMRCEVVLRHRDAARLRRLYEQIIASADKDVDSFVASEATRDFMARLRIGIMADQAPVPDPKDGPPRDIVFLQDVIARHSRMEWYPESAVPVPLDRLIPSRWARRRPSAIDDMKSVVYLCCPVQSSEGWAYMTAMTTFLKGDWDGNSTQRLLPARQLDFNEPTTGSIFKEVHHLGTWVVNYDELLDRRQLLNQGVKVIRYKQAATQGRNLLISSSAPLGLLRSMVLGRLKDLNLELSDADYQALTERFINDANEISGDLVLRAAKRGRNASELMGVVLSRYMIRRELGDKRYFGWYFLDDYADWLGQREEQIADVLALSPETDENGKLKLSVLISESKYIDFASLGAKRKESQKQLRDTVRRIREALFGDPKRLDRDLWLSRFSDLILSGLQFSANAAANIAAWRRAIRDGDCTIFLRSYSHVFVSGPADSSECSEVAQVAELDDSFQEVYSRASLRKLVLSYWNNEDPELLRRGIGGEAIFGPRNFRRPTEIKVPSGSYEPPADEPPSPGSGGNGSTPPPQPGPAPSPAPESSGTPAAPVGAAGGAPSGGDDPASPVWPNARLQEMLTRHVSAGADSAAEAEWLRSVESQCKGGLQQFQLQARLRNSSLTPNAALLKFQGSQNLTIEQVVRRRSEFLTTHGLNIISVKAEPGLVVIAVARPNRRVLQLLDVWKSWHPDCTQGNQDLLIGVKEENGELLTLSPRRHAPHTLIAGSTGSGKSVLMQNIVLSIAATNTPEQSRITLIDPKLGVDYFAFEGLPHIAGGIIDAQDRAISVLRDLVGEMDRRYAILRHNRVANIFELNAKPDASEKLPYLWIIHDEFAEWMLTPEYSNGVSEIVARLGVKARAAGIFLVFAAQRPDAGVMPMQLRANLGNRLILRVDSEGTSEIALGEKGAERLLGKGHLAAKLEGEDGIIMAQVPFISGEELTQIVSTISVQHA